MIKPRYYQQEALNALDESVKRGIRRNAVVMATGSGKSFLGVFRMLKYFKKGKKCIILVDQRTLVWQWRKSIHHVIPEARIGIEMADLHATPQDDIVIATVQTLGRKGKKRIKKFGQNFSLVIADEVHKSPTDTWIRCLEYFGVGNKNFHDDKELCGFTATFMRTDGVSLGELFDDIAFKYPIKDALKDGWLTDIEWIPVSTKTDISQVKSNRDDFNITSLSNTLNNPIRNSLIVKSYKEISGGEKAIVFTSDVDHAYTLEEVFKKHDINAKVIEANTDKKKRDKWINSFKDVNGEVKVLLNYATCTEGFDAPDATTLILARPIKSPVLYTQVVGRGLRPSSDSMVDLFNEKDEKFERRNAIELSLKPACKLIDLCDVWGSHDINTPAKLFGLNRDINTRDKKRLFKEVVEPLEELKMETGVDISTIVDINDIDMIVKREKVDITKFKTPSSISDMTNKTWMSIESGGYEIVFNDEGKALIIEKDEGKKLLGKEGYKLLEYDIKNKITKELNTFNSLEGAFKVADEYIEACEWDTTFKERKEWMDLEPSQKQIKELLRLYTYRKGQPNEYCEFIKLPDRYDDTGERKLKYKKTGELVDRELASKLIGLKYGK